MLMRSFTRTPDPYGDQVVGNAKETSCARYGIGRSNGRNAQSAKWLRDLDSGDKGCIATPLKGLPRSHVGCARSTRHPDLDRPSGSRWPRQNNWGCRRTNRSYWSLSRLENFTQPRRQKPSV